MKNKIIILVFSFMLIANFGYSQNNGENESLGLPGDNLNLYATLKLFQESETLELFEKNLNDQETRINNLDLNGDNQIDYIRVIDNVDNNVHLITLQVAINNTENQDVAVIVVQKDNDRIHIQLIGDEALYGKDYIIEPNIAADNYSGGTPNPGYTGGNISYSNRGTTVINNYNNSEIANWPMVVYIYAPIYKPWSSPWYWGYYPTYWHSWNPFYWHYYWGYQYHWNYYYQSHYRHWNHHRYQRWNDFYYRQRRSASSTFNASKERGDYKVTYSRPEMAEKGSEVYRQKYPNSPSAKVQLPNLQKPENKSILNPYENKRSIDNNQNINNSYYNRKPSINNQNVVKPDYRRPEGNNQAIIKQNNGRKPSNNATDVRNNPNNNVNPSSNRPNNNYKQNPPVNRQNSTQPASKGENRNSKNAEKQSEKRN
ncbi:MAG: hypothetical protein HXX18_00370 [Bacteroidetes bacterium]|nr:hypothetical protein [Bacteroidota bacterium]